LLDGTVTKEWYFCDFVFDKSTLQISKTLSLKKKCGKCNNSVSDTCRNVSQQWQLVEF